MFYENLLELMKEKGISKAQLADEIGIGKNQIKYWEKNKNTPSGETMQKLADFFNVTIEFLLRENDDNLEKFALYGEIRDLTDTEMEDILNYIRKKKSERKE